MNKTIIYENNDNKSAGYVLENTISEIENELINHGIPVIVDGKKTLELINFNFNVDFGNGKIDLLNIKKHLLEYCETNGINFEDVQKLEKDEYDRIEKEIYKKFELFDDDINSRRVLFTDDCWLSMIHLLVRNNKIYCNLNLRSSDCINKLFSDLLLVSKIIRKLQDKLNIDSAALDVKASSMHIYILEP